MTLAHWLRSCFTPRPTTRTRPRACRLGVEQLEDRLTPSTGGLLDPTFGSGGQVMTSFTNYYDGAHAVTTQSDGKIVIAGLTAAANSKTGNDFLVARYNADGSVDTSFGSGGYTATDFSRGSDIANAVALQPQASGPSKILAAGSAVVSNSYDFAVTRYNANGTLDTTFGNKGKVTTALSGNWSIESMVVDGAGRILVAGVPLSGTSGDLTLVRYTANGALDTTFGSGGKLDTGIRGGASHSLALQADGKIIVAATTLDPATSTDEFVVARFNANGTRDTTFGSGGSVATHPGNSDSFGGVAIQGDGKIIVAGMESGLDPDGVDRQGEYLLRYNPNGTLDASFGAGGVVYLVNPSGLLGQNAAGVAVQADGQIVAGGTFEDATGQQSQFVAMRVSTTGSLDTGYGTGGWASTPVGYGGTGTALALALEPDGQLVLAGYARPTANTHPTDVALVRFLTSPQIGSFTANPNPASAGSNVTLSVSNISDGNPNSTLTQVAFYLDSNNDGTLEPGTDTLLGYAIQTSPGVWTLTFSTSAMGLTAGTYTLFAQAEDSYGTFGDVASLDLQLM